MTNLSIQKREAGTGVDALRALGRVPAVMYGPKFESLSISIGAVDFRKALAAAGESTIVTLEGDGLSEETLIHDVQFDPVSGEPLHVDFYVVEKGKKVQVAVPVEFVGESAAIKAGADLIKVMHELEIEALPKDLPHELTIDISVLVEVDSQIHAKDVVLPAGVTLITDGDEVVVIAAAHAEESEDVTAEGFDPTKIAVEERGKKEEEEAAK
jgi:large subunit ribosomal protein L25